ncbi:type II secretion system protein [Metabacillus lacus]|nr:type II secretion system protein [Metabacillus lacus]
MTLLEVLAVIVILGILAAIAVPTFGSLISTSKDRAFEGHAYQLKESAVFYQQSLNRSPPASVTYGDLLKGSMLEPIRDPYSRELFQEGNESYVQFSVDGSISVCLLGYTKRICTAEVGADSSSPDQPVPFQKISTSYISPLVKK